MLGYDKLIKCETGGQKIEGSENRVELTLS